MIIVINVAQSSIIYLYITFMNLLKPYLMHNKYHIMRTVVTYDSF